jgi:uncharacterized protein (TIGR04255 family)
VNGKIQFQPLNDDHAIQSVKFAVFFTTGFGSQLIGAVESAHDQWRDGLPAMSAADINVESGGRSVRGPGVMFAFVQPDASPNWSMHVAGNKIEIECFLYSRWDRVWKTAFDYFTKVMTVFLTQKVDVRPQGVELTVKDVFLTDRSYTLGGLFKRRTNRLPEFMFECGDVWHCNTGWFEGATEFSTHLNNLNCDAIPSGAAIAINVSHFQRIGIEDSGDLIRLAASKYKTIEDEMTKLHDNNKNLLTDILNREIAVRIGLVRA